jgi:eukaryotic-like serine/threonine-protein kinase
LSSVADPLVDSVVAGRYRIIKLLGEGGMGSVYLAEHVAIEKKLALKVLHPEYATKGDIVTRFQQEAISASRIKHPNVLEIFDFGQLENGAFYLAMEFLEGNDLADEITQNRTLEPVRGLRIAFQICRALAAAHASGVVHRDMKPENVFLQRTADGEEIVKIVDFGIAQLRTNEEAAAGASKRRLTRTGMIFGTPEYMSPEQAGGRHADARADVYAVGIILYEMFTGAVPFTGETFLGVLAKHLNDAPPAMSAVFPELQISPELQAVIARALEKDPNARYASMSEFSQALQGTPEGLGLLSRAHEIRAPEPVLALVRAPQGASAPDAVAAATAPAARRETREETRTAVAGTLAPGRSRAGAVIGALVALALAAAAAGAFLLRNRAGEIVTPEATSVPAPPEVRPPPTAEPSVVVAPAPVASLPAPATTIKLKVVTEPPGATLSKDGFQVCDKTPCEVLASPNETLELVAVKDALSGKAKVLAQRDQSVSIRLLGAKKPPKERLCEVEVDGLKIVRPCGP